MYQVISLDLSLCLLLCVPANTHDYVCCPIRIAPNVHINISEACVYTITSQEEYSHIHHTCPPLWAVVVCSLLEGAPLVPSVRVRPCPWWRGPGWGEPLWALLPGGPLHVEGALLHDSWSTRETGFRRTRAWAWMHPSDGCHRIIILYDCASTQWMFRQ